MLLADLVDTSSRVAGTSKRLEKISLLADLLARVHADEVAIAVAYLSGELRQGRIGLGWAAIRNAKPATAAPHPGLTLLEVDAAFDRIANARGAGSAKERTRLLTALLGHATEPEQDFLGRLIFGELRQGALEGVMVEAIARAAKVPAPAVRRAHLMAGDLVQVAVTALTGGESALAVFGVELFRPLQPMLAGSAENVAHALATLGTAALEYKLDGVRIQVHKREGEVRIYSRELNEVTESVPELVERVRALPARELVLDGEAIALRENGAPHPFQITMRRFGRKLDVAKLREELPLRAFFFDCIYCDGETLIDQPGERRMAALSQAVGGELTVPRIITSDVGEAESFLERARTAGHEGLVAKALDAPYDAGRRGSSWLKVKFTETLDLVVLAVEWGSGRREGWLSNLHLGARDPSTGDFVMLGKTFKGLTDEILTWQTEQLLQRETRREGHCVHVRPELVVEIAFDAVQASPRYPGGMALRFARVKAYRPDKKPEDADTV